MSSNRYCFLGGLFRRSIARYVFDGSSLVVLTGLVVTVLMPVERVRAQQPIHPKDSVNVTQLISALKNHEAERRQLEHTDIQDVRVVSVEDVRERLDRVQVERLDRALRKSHTEALPVYLKDYTPITDALESEPSSGVSIWDLVAIDVLKGGYVIVYYMPGW